MEQSGHDQLLRHAFSKQAQTFNRSAVANSARILDEILAMAAPARSERWLDAACGPGIVSRRLAPSAREVLGIDLTPAMVELARAEAVDAGLVNATFEAGDATATGLAAASFDGAVTRFSVHHLPVPARLFDELARVVRPGGRIIVADHLADEGGAAAAWSQEIEHLRDPSHWGCLSAERLRGLGQQAELKLDDERQLEIELDFDDWLERGGSDPGAHELIERALADRPAMSDCFKVCDRGGRRVLTLQLWLGCWRP